MFHFELKPGNLAEGKALELYLNYSDSAVYFISA